MKRLLVVVDMQRDFVTGPLSTPQAREIVSAVKALTERAEAVVYTQDSHGADYLSTREGKGLPVPHCLRGSAGWEIVPEVYKAGSRVFEKETFGSLALAEFARAERFDKITLCGVCTDICVVSNALLLKAYLPEAEIEIAEGACAGTTPRRHRAAIETMKSCQIAAV